MYEEEKPSLPYLLTKKKRVSLPRSTEILLSKIDCIRLTVFGFSGDSFGESRLDGLRIPQISQPTLPTVRFVPRPIFNYRSPDLFFLSVPRDTSSRETNRRREHASRAKFLIRGRDRTPLLLPSLRGNFGRRQAARRESSTREFARKTQVERRNSNIETMFGRIVSRAKAARGSSSRPLGWITSCPTGDYPDGCA